MEKAKELVKLNTRHLAKRQWTWFRREEGIQWVEWEPADQFKDIVQKIVNKVEPVSN